MRYVCAAVHDSKALVFSNPMMFRTTAEAVRSFTAAVNDSTHGSAISSHPGDFTLIHIATWDDDEGIFTPLANGHVVLANGASLIAPTSQLSLMEA